MGLTRMNSGKQTGLLVAQFGNWNLRQTADIRYKVAAIDPVNGKANYAFGVKDGRIDTHAGLDCTKLAQEHPELLKNIEEYFKAQLVIKEEPQSFEDADPYGDLAISRRQKLTPEQNWRRGLLLMRRMEFEHAAVHGAGIWESGIRMLWAAQFGTKILESDMEKARTWITHRKGAVNLKDLLNAEKDYYGGKFAPHSSVNLEAQLAMLAGALEFENVEEKYEAVQSPERDTGIDSREDGLGNGEGEDNERSNILQQSGGSDREPEKGSASGSDEPGPEDPLAAFR